MTTTASQPITRTLPIPQATQPQASQATPSMPSTHGPRTTKDQDQDQNQDQNQDQDQDQDQDKDQDQDQDQDNHWQTVQSKRPHTSPDSYPYLTKRGRGRPRGSTRASRNTRDIRSFSRANPTEPMDYTPASSL
jgi:hypothetical protein